MSVHSSNDPNCTGARSVSTNTGARSVSTNTGDESVSTNTGAWSVSINTGAWSAAIVGGGHSIAIVTGLKGKAKGRLTDWLVLTERNNTGEITGIRAVPVDGKKIKEDVFYTLVNGKIEATT